MCRCPEVQLNISIGPEIRPDLSQLLELQARERCGIVMLPCDDISAINISIAMIRPVHIDDRIT